MTDTEIQVLLVEDDADDRELTARFLKKAKGPRFSVVNAASMDEATQSVAEALPHAILLDLTLPDSRGWQTFEAMRTAAPSVPIIVLTGLSDEDLGLQVLNKGAQDYLVKGAFSADGLSRAIRYSIERMRAEDTVRRYREHLEELVMERTAELEKTNAQLAREIGERKQAEEARRRLQAALLESRKLEAVGRLSSGVAHEFNEALTVITGYSELLAERFGADDPAYADLRHIIDAAQSASELTQQLLAVGRRQVMRTKVVDANLLLTGAAAVVAPLLGHSVKMTTQLSSEPVFVEADSGQLETLLMNLALNARDAMPNGGTVTVRVQNVIVDSRVDDGLMSAGRYVCIEVKDTGCGMEPVVLEHIFEPFYTTKDDRASSGLGLSVAYGVVKAHGGWMEARSEPGKGSNFMVYLPAATHALDNHYPEGSAGQEGEQRCCESVLIVEDDSRILKFLEQTLTRSGYVVRSASSFSDARSAFDEAGGDFDLLFSDVVLGDGSGVDLANELVAKSDRLRVLMTSGYSDGRACRAEIVGRGFSFIPKPYAVSALREKLRAVLGQAEDAEASPKEAVSAG